MKTIVCALAAALMFGAVSLPAQAGTLTIYNKNCTKLPDIERVTVHVYDGRLGCKTDTKVTVNKGEFKTITLHEYYRDSVCTYRHEAMGTVDGKRDVLGTEDSKVTCKKNWLSVCQCTKD